MLTGSRQHGEIGIRQQWDLETPAPQTLPTCHPSIDANDILSAAQLGQMLFKMNPKTVPGGLWRLFRTLQLYVDARAIEDAS